MANIIVVIILLAVVAWAIRATIRRHKNRALGGDCCSGDCSACRRASKKK